MKFSLKTVDEQAVALRRLRMRLDRLNAHMAYAYGRHGQSVPQSLIERYETLQKQYRDIMEDMTT